MFRDFCKSKSISLYVYLPYNKFNFINANQIYFHNDSILPSHCWVSSFLLYPNTQAQVKLPSLLTQLEFDGQFPSLVSHSLMSEKPRNYKSFIFNSYLCNNYISELELNDFLYYS